MGRIFKYEMINYNMKSEEKNALGITADKDEFSEWFTQLMIKADLADYTKVSGCLVFKPNSWAMWEKIQELANIRFKEAGIKNVNFPLFIPESLLVKEQEHVKGFSPEVAWVTHAGDTKLPERLAVRPTSEAIMYDSYSKWIRSWRDLPLRYNQWSNVVRWEFSHPVPFFRTREFIFNEGHTVFSKQAEALNEEKEILNIYEDICENYLALYGLEGRKTDSEKFAGAVFTSKIHYIIPNGKVAEGPAFHHDGQNFARAYDIKFLNEKEKEEFAWQNTWAISTRMLGVMFAVHSDDKGLILPPKMAPNQIVIIPILFDDSKKEVIELAEKISKELRKFNAFVDARENYKPGFKYNEWELKGIPLRIEIGPKDLDKKQVIAVRRDTNEKVIIRISEITKEIPKILDDIQKKLFDKSKKLFESKIEKAEKLAELKKAINNKMVCVVPLCKNPECEGKIKFETGGAKALFISEKEKIKNEKCIICGKKADYLIYVGKSY